MTQQEFFDRYQYNVRTDKIGGGSFGTVYKSFDTIRDRYVAIKVAEVKEFSGKEFSLKSELEAFQKIPAHTNIAHYEAVYQFELPAGIFDYAVMQYYPAGNLKTLLSAQTLTNVQRKEIILGLIKGISHLHQHNIIHRDLKPANILLAQRGDTFIPKITDFGLSKYANTALDSQFSNSFGGGTLVYSAPEQLLGEPLRFNADLWSLGVIIYEFFLHKNPFSIVQESGATTAREMAIYNNIIEATLPADVQSIPSPYREMVLKCIVKKPEERVKSGEELLELLNDKVRLNKQFDFEKPEVRVSQKQNETDGTQLMPPKININQNVSAEDKKTKSTNWKAIVFFVLTVGISGFIVFFVKTLNVDPVLIGETGWLTDSRDAQKYPWKKMKDGKKWMTKNLNFNLEGSICFESDPQNCDKYGRLYQWYVLGDVCPEGWKVPTEKEWLEMTRYYGYHGGSGGRGYKNLLKGGTSGFNAIIGNGQRYYDDRYNDDNDSGYYWSSTKKDNASIWVFSFDSLNKEFRHWYTGENDFFSCRCIED